MAGIREKADVYFMFDTEPDRSTLDTSTLAWELLTHGFTRRVFRQAARSIYHRIIRPIFAEVTPDETEDKISLATHGLTESIYQCKLKIGEAEKDENEEVAKKEREKNGGWFSNEDVDRPKTIPWLLVKVKIPRQHEERADYDRSSIAYSIIDQNNVDSVKPEQVHAKWSTDMNQLKLIYHEAEMYDKLRRAPEVTLTPKFYGFYEKYIGDFAFGIAVYERSVKFKKASEQKKNIAIQAKFVRAVQRLHEQGICHNQLLEGNRVIGFRMSDNVRINEETNDVIFVNFEKATKHKGFTCPSINSDLTSKGCKELDDIYEYYKPTYLRLQKELENNDTEINWDARSTTSYYPS